eukprot:CAMPEP_0185777988 /NCGR_PEP_ID=MMETSP1174-20130828/91284_1 /TAXON_ID=35687 /ORGANISM="Dictyocha speculum, Strain CCMP1381" /LENGTH=432 /DNA_ID=CAMNT_0028466569 /DNA_START=23 /DNA_END=1321 /DNA_ORIENTATION=+
MAAVPAVETAVEVNRRGFRNSVTLSEKWDGRLSDMADVQVGGHLKKEGKKGGMLLLEPHFILKPLPHDCREANEVGFYETIKRLSSNSDDIGSLYGMQNYLCEFYGCRKPAEVESCESATGLLLEEDVTYLVLHDVTKSFKHACVMDLKMGKHAYEEGASPEKKQKTLSKYPWMETIGCRLVGMRVYQSLTDSYHDLGKDFGRTIETNLQLKEAFRQFFTHDDIGLRFDVLSQYCHHLRMLIECFKHQAVFHFVSSSLLFVYEGHLGETIEGTSGAQTTCLENPPFSSLPPAQLKMIDFAHATEATSMDENYLFGLETTLECLDALLSECPTHQGTKPDDPLLHKASDDDAIGSQRTSPPPPAVSLLSSEDDCGESHSNTPQKSVSACPQTQDPHELAPHELAPHELSENGEASDQPIEDEKGSLCLKQGDS